MLDMSIAMLNPEHAEDSIESLLRSGMTQQWNRTRTEAGDQIAGLFRCDFEPNQQRQSLLIPIHPPLVSTPTVEAICLEHDARVRITDTQKFGVRLEIVLAAAEDHAQTVFVDIVIASAQPQTATHPPADNPSADP